MRWVILTDDHPPTPGGVATWTAAIARGLSASGDDVEVFARHRPGLPPGVRGVRGPSFGRYGGWWLRVAARRSLRRADAVLATTWPVAVGVAGTIGAPLHVVFHGSDLTRPLRPPPARVLDRARLWAVSGWLAEKVADRGRRAEVLPAPVEVAPPRLPSRGPERWAMVARAVPGKGGERFVRLVAEAGVDGLLIGGGPELSRWRRLAASLGARVRFTGEVPHARVAELLREADLALLLPRADGPGEGLGLSLLEAAAVGVPAVGCRTGGVPEAVGPGLLLDDPDDAPRSVAAIRAWWTPRRGEAQRAWLAEHHGVGRAVACLRAAVERRG